jgi:hypothetical protein
MFSTSAVYSLTLERLTKVTKHRYFYVVASILLLLLLLGAVLVVATVVVYSKSKQPMEAYSSRTFSSKKDAFSMWGSAGGVSEENVWFLRDFDNPVYSSGNDRDRVYLRMEGEGIHTILIKTDRDSEKRNNSIAFTVLEFDMLRLMLEEKYNYHTGNDTQTSRVIFNGRRRVLMEYLPGRSEEEERVRFTLIKYIAKNSTWVVRNSVILTNPKVKVLMKIYRKIHDKLESYEYRIGPTMTLGRDDDDNNGESDNDGITPPKSRRLEDVAEPMDSGERSSSSILLDNNMGVDEH